MIGEKSRKILCFMGYTLAVVMFWNVQGWGSEPSKVLKLDDITVSAKSERLSAAAPSATVITADDLKDEHMEKTLYILQKVPGVIIQDYGQGAVASQFSMRGLRLGHNTGAAIFVDGVPINESTSHGDGYGDFNTIIPEDIEYAEVIKGPSSALYGQFARAGVVNIITKRQGNFSLYKLGGGDFKRQRFAASTGHSKENLSSVFGVELSRSEGATDRSAMSLGNATGKITCDINDKLTAGLTLNMHTTNWEHPEYLTREQWDQGDYWAAKALGGGERFRYGGSMNMTYVTSDTSNLNMMLYGYTMNLTRYRDRDYTVDEEYHDRDMYGGSLSYINRSDLWGMKNSFVAGFDGQLELTHTINATNASRIPSAREEITVDGDSSITTLSGYFQNALSPSPMWTFQLGGRIDTVGGDLEDHENDSDSDMDRFTIFSPKAEIDFTPKKGYMLFTTYGEGFKLPNGFDKFTYPNLTEETYRQYELGLEYTGLDFFKGTLTGYVLDIDDEIVSIDAEGTKENQGKTRRTGLELALDYTPVSHVSVYGSLGYVKGKYKDYWKDGEDYSDTDIGRIPEWVYSVGAKWSPPLGVFGSMDYRYVGEGYLKDYPKGDTGERRYTMDYWVADAQIGYRWDIYSLILDVKNIFDERYPSTESATSLRTANPRSFFVTMSVSY